MWPIKFSGFSWLGVTVLTILVWSNLKNQTILSAGVNNLSPIVVYAEKENTKKDVLPFTQDNWLQKVQQDIASREYHINYAADKKYHQSPNRANNTRITYYPRSIQIAPRTLEEYEETPPTEPNTERKLSKTYEDYTLHLEVKGYGTTKKIVHPFHAEKLISENNEAFAQDGHMQVEYINNEEGTRQNFIIHQPIKGNELAVHLNINTSLTVTQENEGSIKFTGKQNSTQLYYKDLKVWDATGKVLPSEMLLKNEYQTYTLVLAVNTTEAKYPITIDPIVTNGTPANANGVIEGNLVSLTMGNSVSSAGDVNGDGYSDVIVCAIAYENGQSFEGAAFVYHGSASGISSTAAAILEGNQVNSWFGFSVSSAGDVNGDGYSDVVVGAKYYDNGQTNEGAAFVYHGSTSGISTTASAILESNQVNTRMGSSVSSAGDVNGDGYSDVIVGAPYYDNGQSGEGAVLVYHGSANGISTTASAILDSNHASAQMGNSVSSAGDVNGDGYSDVIVGVSNYDNGQLNEGAVFLYHGSASGLSTTVSAILESNQAAARMGSSVSRAGDVNGDGYSDVMVATYLYDNGQIDEGVAFIYHGSVSGISTSASAMLESNQASARMGWSVSCAGDVNGDGYSDVIVAADHYTNDQANEGSAFVYHGSANGLINTDAAKVESNQANAQMGYSVSSAGDVNGDGYNDVVVGAYGYTNGQAAEGMAFIYHGSASGLSSAPAAMLESNQASAYMGWSVSSAGDVNGDGYSDVIIGAHLYDNNQSNEGAVYIYQGSASGIVSSSPLIIESNQGSARMGSSVTSAGDVNGDGYCDVIAGAEYYANGQANEGAAFLYYGSSTGTTTTGAVMLELNIASSYFGSAVGCAGDVNH